MRRFLSRFRSLWSVLLVAAATAGLAQAKSELGPTPPIPVEEGRKQARELVEDLLKLKPAASSTERLLVKITDADDNRTEVPVTFSVLLTPTNYLSIYETTSGPARRSKLTIASAENAPNEYLLSEPPEAPPRKLSPGELMSPFAGSDFWVADLGLEFLHWPQQRITKKEMRRSLFCNVLESINPEPTPSGYAKVESWVAVNRPEDIVIVHADAYDAKGRRVKQFIPTKVRKVNGAWELAEMKIRNLQTGSSTRIEFQPGPQH